MEGSIKPFLRWAGGKTWLIKHIDNLLPPNGFRRYHEPFLGGGAMFFALKPNRRSFLSDLNGDLINTYRCIKRRPEKIIRNLREFENTEEFYYSLRETDFADPYEKAAQFIYLNQTSFNGIYRVNLDGKYNVPYGYRTKNFLDESALQFASRALRQTRINAFDFNEAKRKIRRKDLVFLDPPYTVAHYNNGFIKYNDKLFSLDDQKRLSSLIDYIKSKGAYYILTNAAHETIKEIFDKNDLIIPMSRASLIGGKQAKRGHYKEFIFTNAIQQYE